MKPGVPDAFLHKVRGYNAPGMPVHGVVMIDIQPQGPSWLRSLPCRTRANEIEDRYPIDALPLALKGVSHWFPSGF